MSDSSYTFVGFRNGQHLSAARLEYKKITTQLMRGDEWVEFIDPGGNPYVFRAEQVDCVALFESDRREVFLRWARERDDWEEVIYPSEDEPWK